MPPQVRARADVIARYGERVRILGRYELRALADVRGRVWSHGPFVVLGDGTLVFFEPRERAAAEIAAHEGHGVEVIGVLAPPPAPSFDVASVTVESLRIVEAGPGQGP